MSRDNLSKYREVVEGVLPDGAKKYAPLVLGCVKTHLGALNRDDNYYHTLIAANALLVVWQKWQADRDQYVEAQFLALAKKSVRGYLLNEDKSRIAEQKGIRQDQEEREASDRYIREEEEREIQEAAAKARQETAVIKPEPKYVPPFEILS